MRLVLQRVGLVLAIAGIAVLCLSSAWLAAAIGVITAAIVAVDMVAFARPPAVPLVREDRPETISVDLSRRQ